MRLVMHHTSCHCGVHTSPLSPTLCLSRTTPCLLTTVFICLSEAQAYLGSKGLSEAVAQAANMRHMLQRQPQLQPTVYSHYGISISCCCCCCHLTIIIIPHMLTFCSSKPNQCVSACCAMQQCMSAVTPSLTQSLSTDVGHCCAASVNTCRQSAAHRQPGHIS